MRQHRVRRARYARLAYNSGAAPRTVAPDMPLAVFPSETIPPQQLQVARWLLACCALVFAMVVLGGATRLTHSGLSIVEWQPLVGAIPPLSQQDWQELFDKYRQTPEYLKKNAGMSLDAFKDIFWLEYFHRLLGRVIGVAFLLPFLWFLARGRLTAPLGWKLAGIFLLGGLQGAMGWYMVKSGLVDNPRVSQYRLTAHLSLAFVIYSAMLWTALDLLDRGMHAAENSARRLRTWAWVITALICYMVVSGGFVAGTRAGLAYNTFPLMHGHVVPPDYFALAPWYENFFSNVGAVQFNHRAGAWLLAGLVPWFWWRALHTPLPDRTRRLCHLLLAAVALQITLGITTLLNAVPVALGTAHQGTALAVLTVALILNHALRSKRRATATGFATAARTA